MKKLFYGLLQEALHKFLKHFFLRITCRGNLKSIHWVFSQEVLKKCEFLQGVSAGVFEGFLEKIIQVFLGHFFRNNLRNSPVIFVQFLEDFWRILGEMAETTLQRFLKTTQKIFLIEPQ